MEPDDPPPKVYGFKAREFKRDNPTGPAAAPMPTVKDLAKMAGAPTPIGRGGATGAKAGDPNDVYAALHHNRAIEQAHGLDQLEIRKIRRRKLRDYCLIMVPTEVLLGAVTFFGRGNPMVFVCGLAGMVMIGVTITWIMWQLIDRY